MDDGSNPRVVALFPGALGDLVLAADALAALQARYPGARTILAVNGWLREVAAVSGAADVVACLDDAAAAGLFGGTRWPAWFGDRPHLHAWVGAGDPEVQARLRASTASATFHRVVRDDGPGHASRAYAEQVGASPGAAARWALPAPSARVRALLASADDRLLVVHAGAGAVRKRWASGGFAEIARRWRARGGDVAELAGPAEGGLEPIVGARRLADWSLVEVLALLGGARRYVGNDSGISHLAGVAGVRGVVVFGATSARRWAPHRGRLAVVESRAPCVDGIALAAVPSDAVWGALGGGACLDKVRGRK